jgi:hypothetical protein
MKRLQLIAMTVLAVAIIYVIYKIESVDRHQVIRETVSESFTAQEQRLVDREAIINALRSEAQIVGLSGEVDKAVRYSDANWLGAREVTMRLTGTFKLGVNIADIRSDRIFVSASDNGDHNVVTIVMPKPVLIALDLPYDQMRIDEDKSILRRHFSDEQLRELYVEARGLVIGELSTDEATQRKAQELTQQAIEQLLRVIPNVDEVRFVEL